MFQETIKSLSDNFRQKVTNPYLGTVLIVWCFENWPLLYGLCNFDEESKLVDKIEYIKQYFLNNPFFTGVIQAIGFGMLVLIATFVLLNVSRLIVNFFENVVTPFVYKVTDKSSIVLKSDYENLLKENIALKEKVEKEREEKFRYQKERDSFEAKVIELSTIVSDKPKDTLNLHGENPNDKQELEEINSNLQKLVEFNSHPELRDVITSIDNGWGVPNKSEVIQRMINRGLVKEIEMFNLTEKQREQLIKSQVKFLTFTRLGQKVAEAYKKKYD